MRVAPGADMPGPLLADAAGTREYGMPGPGTAPGAAPGMRVACAQGAAVEGMPAGGGSDVGAFVADAFSLDIDGGAADPCCAAAVAASAIG